MSRRADTSFSAEGVPTGWRVALGLGFVFVALQPFFYWPAYAGDAQIHLIYGENAARAALYQFNLGETSSGVTSTGFMLWLAMWFRLVPSDVVPIVAKVTGMIAYWATTAMLYGLARDLLRSPAWAAAIALVFGGMPGATFNSSIGMETSLFVAISVGWLWWAARRDWFSGQSVGLAHEFGLGLLLGLGFWFRPEAALIGACAFGLRAGLALRNKAVAQVAAGLFLSAAAALAVGLSVLAFHHAWTGEWLPTSGRARVFIAHVISPSFGPFLFDSAFPIRLAAYAPISIFFFAGLPAVWRRSDELGIGDAARFSSMVFGAGFALYTFVTGAHHLARYTAFLMPGFALIAGASARHLYMNWNDRAPQFALPYRSQAYAAIALSIAGLYLAESAERFNRTVLNDQAWEGGVAGLNGARFAPARRKQVSNEWIERLGNPVERPIVIGLQEVQFRYEVDDRFLVRSLDGRVDSRLFDFVTPTNVNHIGYLRDRGVQYLFDAPHYVNDPTKWSLVFLRSLEPGQFHVHGGLRFTHLRSSRVWRVDEEAGLGIDTGRPGRAGKRARKRQQRLLEQGLP